MVDEPVIAPVNAQLFITAYPSATPIIPPCVPSPSISDAIVTSDIQFSILDVHPLTTCIAIPAANFTLVLMVPVTVRFLMVQLPIRPKTATSLLLLWFTVMVWRSPSKLPPYGLLDVPMETNLLLPKSISPVSTAFAVVFPLFTCSANQYSSSSLLI